MKQACRKLDTFTVKILNMNENDASRRSQSGYNNNNNADVESSNGCPLEDR